MGQAPDFTGVDDAAREAVQSGEIPGIVVLVGRGNEILLHRSYGSRRLVPDMTPMTVDTIFDIASLTKPLGTTLAVMSLVEHGSLKLDAPVGRYLQEFRTKPFAQVTIQRLLTHTAGFPAVPPTAAVTASHPATMRALAKLPFDYPPGSGTQYSDVGFIILGEVVARVRAILRRTGDEADGSVHRYADLVLDEQTHEVFRAGTAVHLTATEFALLHLLLLHPRRVLSKADIVAHLWPDDPGRDDTIVETFVSYLRRKVDRQGLPLIHTIRRVGYTLRLPGEES